MTTEEKKNWLVGAMGFCALFFVLVISLCVFLSSSKRTAEENKAKQDAQYLAAAQRQQIVNNEPVLVSQCITPCSMFVGWGQRTVWADGYPLKIKYRGLDWVEYPGVKDVFVKLPGEFQPGDAEFVSPQNLHLLVQVYSK